VRSQRRPFTDVRKGGGDDDEIEFQQEHLMIINER
jgi:hypothetical protein